MGNALEDSEVKLLKKEKNQTALEIKGVATSFARNLSEGDLGKEMMEELTAEPKKIGWFKKLINRIFTTI